MSDNNGNNKNNLLQHIRSQHEGLAYVYNEFDYEAAYKNDQQHHLRSKHEKGLAKTSMIAFLVIIMQIIRIIFQRILDLDMRI